MYHSVRFARPRRSIAALTLALSAALIVTIPAAAFNSSWTQPKQVFAHTTLPKHTTAVDAAGKVHIATEKGTTGVWYISNKSGSWQQCQVSTGNDRTPSIAVDGSSVHIAFARFSDGAKGIHTASGVPAAGGDCGLEIKKRWSGNGFQTALAASAGQLSVAFRTSDKKLKFIKGAATDPTWSTKETIDGKCCTSGVAIALTAGGAPRVAYGDGTSRAEGLKFGVRTSKGWKKSKAHSGRIKHVSLLLDTDFDPFKHKYTNAPTIAYVVKNKGTYVASKGSAGTGGTWGKRSLGNRFQPPDVDYRNGVTSVVYGNNGNLFHTRQSGGIWFETKLSGGGTDGKPQLNADQLTFGRSTGIYYTRRK